jgi:hypothetical protein
MKISFSDTLWTKISHRYYYCDNLALMFFCVYYSYLLNRVTQCLGATSGTKKISARELTHAQILLHADEESSTGSLKDTENK